VVRVIKGEVIIVDFPFSDLSNFKRRPALVISPLNRDDAIVCQITTRNSSDGYSISLDINDFAAGSLNQLSNIRPNRLFTVDTNIINRVIGQVNQAKIDEVVNSIIQIIR
jgi:mRNA interferase MazF